MGRLCFLSVGFVVILPQVAWATDGIDFPALSLAPFVLMLLAIALLPMVAGGFWHSHFRKLLVSLVLSAPVIGYLYWLEWDTGHAVTERLVHALLEYLDFIILLASLYTVAGGVVVETSARAGPMVNLLILAIGAVLGNVFGTTGASMLLIRPFLRINANRTYKAHLPVFFIFLVSNLGGLITPLGDPPLFLGFLRGVDFFWTLHLLPHWAVAVGSVLAIFFVVDGIAVLREPEGARYGAGEARGLLHVRGLINFLFLLGILVAVLLQSRTIADAVRHGLSRFFDCADLHLVSAQVWAEHLQEGRVFPLPGAALMVLMAILSLAVTPRLVRRANEFSWGAIIEVAVLFLGVFVTMVPALGYLAMHSRELNITQPWQYFWITGALSSFLDNAPTYLTFATIASEGQDLGIFSVAAGQPHPLLLAISAGAVFMGANTYIGNGPNFMVKAIADEFGYKTPSFFGYMLYAIIFLLPVFGLVTWLFFW